MLLLDYRHDDYSRIIIIIKMILPGGCHDQIHVLLPRQIVTVDTLLNYQVSDNIEKQPTYQP